MVRQIKKKKKILNNNLSPRKFVFVFALQSTLFAIGRIAAMESTSLLLEFAFISSNL